MSDIKVYEAPLAQMARANDFYLKVGYTYGIQPTDRVVVAVSDELIIGLGRISEEFGHKILRGMQVEQHYQRQGIGNRILGELNKIIGSFECFCIPHGWLEDFYGQIGFSKVDAVIAPQFLQERFTVNLKKYPHLIMMKRERA